MTLGQQLEVGRKPSGDLLSAQHIQASGSELDRQRNAI
jgi:hypothetical protein